MRIEKIVLMVALMAVPGSAMAMEEPSREDIQGSCAEATESSDDVTINGFGQCGTGACPSGWHATNISCNLSCGSCNGFPNAAYCVPNSGSFQQCGTTCPSGWRATSYSCNLSCGSCPNNSSNAAYCVPN